MKIRGKRLKILSSSTTTTTTNTEDFVGTIVMNVPDGSYAADSISSDFTNIPVTVSGGALEAQSNATGWLWRTVLSGRDVELDIEDYKGILLFRTTGNRGIGILRSGPYMGLVIMNDVTKMDNTATNLNQVISKKAGTGIWYDSGSPTAGDKTFDQDYSHLVSGPGSFTVGISGIELYMKWNGVKIISKKIALEMKSGTLGLYSVESSGYSTMPVIRFMNRVPCLSTETEIHIADFGPKTTTTTGSIYTTSPYTLTVATSSGLEVGDVLLVEPGNEIDTWTGVTTTDQRGHLGVGGNWPEQSVNTVADLATFVPSPGTGIDIGEAGPNYQVCWVKENRKVYGYYHDGWFAKGFNTNNYGKVNQQGYYTGYTVPKPLRAKIVAISGNIITLDTPCINSTVNAVVSVDAWEAFDNPMWTGNSVHQYGTNVIAPRTMIFPAGTYTFSERLTTRDKYAGWTIKGAGKDVTIFRSPKNNAPMAISFGGVGLTIKDFTLQSYGVLNGAHGFRWWDTKGYNNNGTIPPNQEPSGGDFFRGIGFNNDDVHLSNVKVIDAYTQAVGGGGNNVIVDYVDIVHTTGVAQYMAWQMVVTAGQDILFDHCTFDSPEMISAFESFALTNVTFQNCTIRNGRMSNNSSYGMQIKNCSFTFTRNAGKAWWLSYSEPIISFNRNAYNQGYGGLVENTTMHFEDEFDLLENWYISGVAIVNENVVDVEVKNLNYSVADHLVDVPLKGAVAVGSNALCLIDGVTSNVMCEGELTHSWNNEYNVVVHPTLAAGSIVKNCNVRSMLLGTTIDYYNRNNIVSEWFQLVGGGCTPPHGCPVND